MRLAIYIIVVLVAVVLVVFVWGTRLPVAHTASRSAHFDVPPERVWSAITDVAAYPSWRSDVSAVEMLPPNGGMPSWREVSGRDRIAYAADEMRAPSRFVARITDKGLPYGGRWVYELVPDRAGSRLTITEQGEVSNPIFRFMSRYVIGQTATMEKYLAALSRKLARN